MNDKLFGVLSTIAGLIVGWTLNELSYSFRARRENKKILNQLLFIQLEIRNIIVKTDLDFVERQIKELFNKEFSESDVKGLSETVGIVFYGFIQNELNNRFSSKIRELSKDYNRNIILLSRVDPLATYYISNKELIFDYLGYINEYLATIEKSLDLPMLTDGDSKNNIERTFRVSFSEIRSKITPFLRIESIETIETDMKVVAKKLGFLQYCKINHLIKRGHEFSLDNLDIKKIEHYVKSILEKQKNE